MGAAAQEYENWKKEMTSHQTGLEARYDVKKINDPEGKHNECKYFVLDPEHDLPARGALRAYAIGVSMSHPQLSRDLLDWINELNKPEKSD